MAYPNTSAQDIAQLQSQIDALRILVKDYYAEAVVYANMEHPVPSQEVSYMQRQLDLIRRAEDLMPDLMDEAEDDANLTDEEKAAGEPFPREVWCVRACTPGKVCRPFRWADGTLATKTSVQIHEEIIAQ